MNGSLYEIVALAARYLFAAIMLLIMLRAWKITLVDSRRAASLRRLSPETGVCGEFLVLRGHGKVRDGMRYPVIREGLVGSSRKADIRLRSGSVHRSHAFFELTERGLRMRANSGARLYNAAGRSKKEIMLGDGSRVTFGQIEMLLILNEAVNFRAEPDEVMSPDSLFTAPPVREEISLRTEPGPEPVTVMLPDETTAESEINFISIEAESTPLPEEDPEIVFVSVDADAPPVIPPQPSPERLFDVPDDDSWDEPAPVTDDIWDERPVRRAPQQSRTAYDDPYDNI